MQVVFWGAISQDGRLYTRRCQSHISWLSTAWGRLLQVEVTGKSYRKNLTGLGGGRFHEKKGGRFHEMRGGDFTIRGGRFHVDKSRNPLTHAQPLAAMDWPVNEGGGDFTIGHGHLIGIGGGEHIRSRPPVTFLTLALG